ncbi:2-isopropylmalate synthase [Desulfuribacillus stibiiarsenatis]|uniref:2-isopropylmalate synthase n=1 Tax=Desulfuribacillus stibiiarsenatis TaxID=1390249 RepID=A0A1E5L2Q4_9FIRM|nr:2-isopropylmalate synthase [Desulfuribacillus stibiiarsenatis]OEH84408.1 2-isopropylmalate synthase [Desulfuribacillus stibiiarsenatis]
MREIQIFDTTLRDGEQSPGVNLNTNEKLEIASQLERLGVHVMEAGFPAASVGDFEAVKAIANAVKNTTVAALSRSVTKDIDRAWEAVKYAVNPRIHVFIATSSIHMQHKLQKSPEQVLEIAKEMVRYTKKYVSDVQWSAEDAGRSDIEYLKRIIEAVINEGATVINVPDTVGYLMPEEYGELIRRLKTEIPNSHKARFSGHCHNDLGLAVANSLAGIRNGLDQVEGTINGIGERAGNAAIEEIAMALHTRKELYQAKTTLDLSQISRTSQLVSRLTGMMVPRNKAVVGANAFAHESGIHQDGMLKDKSTYEIMTPETIGLKKSSLVLGKHSGRHAFRDKLQDLGFVLSEDLINKAFEQFKELADKKKEVTDADISAIVEEEAITSPQEKYHLDYFQISSGNSTIPTATVRLRTEAGVTQEEAACGDGPINAIYNTIDRLSGEPLALTDYRIRSVSGGTDALGEVFVRVQQGEISVNGRGMSTDILEASVKAYINALNRMIVKKGEMDNGNDSSREDSSCTL